VRNVRHVGDGGPSRRPRYFATVVWETVSPSFSNSPWIRGAPQSGLAACICRISARMSMATAGRPARLGLAARGVSRRDGEIDPAILATCA
jgi:hypothetical protein